MNGPNRPLWSIVSETSSNISLDKLRALPDTTLVYPAHGAGSMCGKSLSTETVSTIGEQKRFNYALQPMSFPEFKQLVTSDQPEAPEYFVYDAIKNRQERPDLESTLSISLKALGVDDVVHLKHQQSQVVDVREAVDFEGAHFVGALNIGLKGKYATWCGSILRHDQPIVVIAEPGSEEEAVDVMALFAAGGIAGVIAGQGLGRRISGPRLQKAFVVALLAVAAIVVIRNLSRPIHLDNLGPSHDKTPGLATEIASIFSSFGVPVVLLRRYNVGDLARPRQRTDGRGDFFP